MVCHEYGDEKAEVKICFIYLLLWLERHVSSHRMTGRLGVWDKLGQERLEGKTCAIFWGWQHKRRETEAGGFLQS